jgi:hypothetical protein
VIYKTYRTYCHCTGFEQIALLSCEHNSHGVAGAADHLLNIGMAVCRIHWPKGQLVVPPEGVVRLLGHQLSSKGPVQEWLVTGTTAAHMQDRIGVALFGQAVSPVTADDELCVIMQPTVGWRAAPVPVVLLPCTASSGERTAQVVQYDHVPSLQQPSLHASVQSARGRMQLAACLAARLCFLLTALWLLQHRQLLASAAGRGGSQLARFVNAQLLWFMSAQPAGGTCSIYCPGSMICSATNAAACQPASLSAQCNTASPPLPLPPPGTGVKLHRHTAELLSLCGLQYASAVQRLLSGWAPLLTNCATGATGVQPACLAVLAAMPCMLQLSMPHA